MITRRRSSAKWAVVVLSPHTPVEPRDEAATSQPAESPSNLPTTLPVPAPPTSMTDLPTGPPATFNALPSVLDALPTSPDVSPCCDDLLDQYRRILESSPMKLEENGWSEEASNPMTISRHFASALALAKRVDVAPRLHEGYQSPKHREGYTPRPPNAWILYRSEQIRQLKKDPAMAKKPQADISKLIGFMWRGESLEVKKYYEEQAAIKKADHAIKYPVYVYRPVRKAKPVPVPDFTFLKLQSPSPTLRRTQSAPRVSRKRSDSARSTRPNLIQAASCPDVTTLHPLQRHPIAASGFGVPITPCEESAFAAMAFLEQEREVRCTDIAPLTYRFPDQQNVGSENHKRQVQDPYLQSSSLELPASSWPDASWRESPDVDSWLPTSPDHTNFYPFSAPASGVTFTFNPVSYGSPSTTWFDFTSDGSTSVASPSSCGSSLPSPSYTPYLRLPSPEPVAAEYTDTWDPQYNEVAEPAHSPYSSPVYTLEQEQELSCLFSM